MEAQASFRKTPRYGFVYGLYVVPGRERSILAQLSLQFGIDERERWATESLGHFLSSSTVCQERLRRRLNQRGAQIPERLAYRTEVVERGAEGRPDVVGAFGSLRHVVIEGKFWASLTDVQPVGYLDSLADDGCLLVVAPHRRLEILGADLVRRCRDAGLSVSGDLSTSATALVQVGGRHWMGLVSWRDLLSDLRSALNDAGDASRASDIDQLDSLCDLEDSEAFLPLNSSDLTNPTPLRLYQYMGLTEQVADRGAREGRLSTQGLRSVGRPMGKYVRYVAADDLQLGLSVDLLRWHRQRPTPLWLEVWVEPGEALRSLETEQPPRVLYEGYNGQPVIPLTPLLHAEHSTVVEHLLGEIMEIVDLVRNCRRTATLNRSGVAEVGSQDDEALT